MAPERVERKLAAILAADVAGYSRLMGKDEEGTLARLKAHRSELIDPKVAEHRGRIVKTTGDGILIEFPSVVEAVRCAVEVQQAMVERNADVPQEKRIQFRVGINLGDIIVEGTDIYGDGVNIAARLEALAEPGGICVSRTVRNQVRDKLPYAFEDMGEHTVKNIARPVPIYGLRATSLASLPRETPLPAATRTHVSSRNVAIAAAVVGLIAAVGGGWWSWSPGKAPPPTPAMAPSTAAIQPSALPLPREPSIAVLPFTNMSDDPSLDYFGDGIAEDLITELARYPELLVSGRNSTFFYKSKPAPVRQIGHELGVRYVVEGSVRKGGDRVRITAQLIDATTDQHVWADRYDEEGDDILALQDQVTWKIVTAISGERGQIREAQHRLAWSKRPGSLDEYDYALRVHSLIYRFNKADMIRARDLALEGLKRFPDSSFLRIKLAWCYFHLARLSGWSENAREDLEQAFRIGSEGIAGNNLPPLGQWHGHWLMSVLYLWSERNFAAALAEREATLALAPNDTDTLLNLSQVLIFAGMPDDAIRSFAKAAERDPHIRGDGYTWLGAAYQLQGQNEQAMMELGKMALPSPFNYEWRAVAYAELNRWDEARSAVAEMLKVNPHITIATLREVLPFRDKADLENHLAMLRKAGLPE